MRHLLYTVSLLLACMTTSICLAQPDSRPLSGLGAPSFGRPEPLPQDQAFAFYVSETGPGQFRITWDLAAGHYLYRHAFQFSLRQGANTEAVALEFSLPDGLRKTDQFFGDIEAYYTRVSADLKLPLTVAKDTVLLIEYQGCADWGFCYPPQQREFRPNP